jgi:hypothetical protein
MCRCSIREFFSFRFGSVHRDFLNVQFGSLDMDRHLTIFIVMSFSTAWPIRKRTVEIRNFFPLLWPGKSPYQRTLTSFRIYGFELAEMLGIEAQPAVSPPGQFNFETVLLYMYITGQSLQILVHIRFYIYSLISTS